MGVNMSRVLELAVPCLLLWGILAASLALDRSRFRDSDTTHVIVMWEEDNS